MKKVLALAALLLALLAFASCAKKQGGMNYKAVEGGLAITGYTDKTTVTELTVPDEIGGVPVVRIEDFGVCNAESLTKITIGKNVASLGGWALTNNQHLTEFAVDPANEHFTAVDGVLFSKDMKTLYYYPCGRNITFDKFGRTEDTTTYEIPDGVETISTKAFYKCYYVDVTKIPESVIRIEEKAFHRASAMTSLTLPSHLEYIGKDAFAYAFGATDAEKITVTIPASIKEIGEYAFFNCDGIAAVNVLAKEEDVTLGSKWQPTSKGKIIEDCPVTFAQ